MSRRSSAWLDTRARSARSHFPRKAG
jgi:hypothetical protein